jgi:hypothetical protein
MTKFLLDAAYAFVTIVGSGFIVLVDIITHIMHGVQRLYDGIIMPALIEGLADLNIILIVFTQMYHECMSRACAYLAHKFLQIAQYSHVKSEKLIHRYWAQ